MNAAKTAATPRTDEARATSDIAPLVEDPDGVPVSLTAELVAVLAVVGAAVTTKLVRETEVLQCVP